MSGRIQTLTTWVKFNYIKQLNFLRIYKFILFINTFLFKILNIDKFYFQLHSGEPN